MTVVEPNLEDGGNAEFEIVDSEGHSYDLVNALSDVHEGFEEEVKKYTITCKACGSKNCKVDDGLHMGSSKTGVYGTIEIVCNVCLASRSYYK